MLSYVVGIIACLSVVDAADWTHIGHNGREDWPALFPHCAGQSQSPVNLDSEKSSTVYNVKLTNDLDIMAGEDAPNYFVVNNGHALGVDTSASKITVSGAGLPKTYTSVGPHFHWGAKNNRGSEHLFNGVAYPLEMHIVSYDAATYATVGDAVASNVQGAAAVVGVMFKLSEEDNPALQRIIDVMQQVQHPNATNKIGIPAFPLTDLLPAETSEYFRYEGSLTTPTCNEVVTWTVMLHPQTVSAKQLAAFRNLHDKEHAPLVDNFRPVQPLNGRTIYKSFQQPSIDLPRAEAEPGRQTGDDDPAENAASAQSSASGLFVAVAAAAKLIGNMAIP